MAEPVRLANRYELRGLLGRGGMGEVYDGWDLRLDRPVAVKLLNSQLASQPEIRTRFESEARAAARLTNPKVVRIFDTGEHEGTAFIVMERLPGRTLADEMAAGPLPEARVRAVLLDMLEALAFAHRNGVLHRDVKPANVLITEDGTAKLADFGIAKIAGQNLTQTGHFIGTATYLAPERLNGLPAGPESDLYSTGIVGYEALTGERPFQADTPLGLIRAINDDPTPSIRSRLPEVEAGLASAIDRATRRLPEERFRSAEEMIEALGGTAAPAGEGDTIVAAHGSRGGTEVLPAVRRASPNRRAWWATAGAVLLAVIIGLVSAGDEDPPPAAGPTQSATTEQPRPGAGGDPGAISGVNSVNFLGPGTLVLEQTGSEESIDVEAPAGLRPLIRTDVAGGRLTVGMEGGTAPNNVGAIVYRVKVGELKELRAAGGGTVEATGISVDSLTVENDGSTDIEMSGETGRLTLTLNGSGNFEGTGLSAENVTAKLNGSGNAVVSASERLEADLSGSGDLEYLGDPEVTQNASGSGRVERG
jgi:predicted Ser/Thr protein kinase